MGSLSLSLTQPQTKVFQDQSRFRVLVAGRRFGKTALACVEIITAAFRKPNQNILYVAPSFGMAKRIMWKPLLQLIPKKKIRVANRSELIIELTNGSTIMLFGAGNYDNIRGSGYDLAVMDEFADIDEEAWTEVIRPALSDREGKALFIGTPQGRGNWSYELFESAKEYDDWARFHFTTLQGGWVSPQEIEKAKRNYDARTFKQEYEASFESTGNLVYDFFNYQQNVVDMDFDPSAETWATWDFNTTENKPNVCILVQRIMDKYYVTKEFVYNNTNTHELAEAVRDYLVEQGFNGSLEVTGDHSGNRNESNATRSDYQTIRTYLKDWSKYGSLVIKTRTVRSIKDRVAATNSLFKPMEGDPKMYIDKRCKNLIEDLERTEWKKVGTGLESAGGKRNDESDALSYFAFNYHPVHRPEATYSSD